MKCVTPMFRRYQIGEHSKGKIVSRKEVLENLNFNPNYISFCLDKMNAETRKKMKGYLYEQIPCRHCWACHLNYSAEWATRIIYECRKYTHNYFVTLTFNDNWLPVLEQIEYKDKIYINPEDGTWNEGSVWEPYMHKFIHDLRQYLQREKNHTGMKYFYCMEYGETTHRPHAHILLMNCPLNTWEFDDWYQDDMYKLHWKTNEIQQFWRYGIIDIGEVEWSSAAYVARYCTKKLHQKNNEDYCREGKLPEFIRMSRGLGMDYYKEHKDEIYKNDEIVMRTVRGNVGSYKPPKAWDRKFKEEHPDQWEMIKLSRLKAAERARKLQSEVSDYTDLKKLEMQEEKINIKAKMLPRVGEW